MALILAAPGTGKTTWINSKFNINKLFEDSDNVCGDLHYKGFEQENHSEKYRMEHYKKIEKKLLFLKEKYGKVILGSLFWDFVPDAIVIIKENQHRKQVENRNDLTWESVCEINKFLFNHAKKYNIPIFNDFNSCAHYIRNEIIEKKI